MPPPPALGELPLPPPESGRYDNWSKEQLNLEMTRLEDSKPSLGLPIVLLSVGGFVALTGVYVASVYLLLITGLFVIVPGIALMVWGAILLAQRISERRLIGQQVNDIQFRLEHSDHPGAMPPPPSVRAATPALLLARF